jgi:hypothetical protein
MKSAVTLASALAFVALPMMAWGAASCPPELAEAKTALKNAQAAMKKGSQAAAKSQDVQAPRTMAGAKAQDVQAPRGQDVQSPRGQDVQSPRGQDVQAPRGQDVQAPRTAVGAKTPDPQAQKVKQASTLIRESEAACKKGDMTLSASKATEAQALLK